MLLAYGTADDVVRPGNSERLAAKLRSFGSPVTVKSYPGVGHIGIILSLAPGLRGLTTLRQDMLDFIRSTARDCGK
jgi:acetyl esterase/lipase